MPRVYDDDDHEDYEEDAGQDWHYDLDDSLPTILCPYCQEEIPEDAPQCPYCGDYISAEDHREKHFPVWITITALVLVLLMGLGSLLAF